MKTLYEILEVSETASKEMIEKAYKTLAKRYHPDLQPAEKKQKAEHQMKIINEAYETLEDETKRSEYDRKLAEERETKRQEEQRKNENANRTNAQSPYEQPHYDTQQPNITQEEYAKMQKQYQKAQQEMQKNMQAEYERKYQKAYEDYLKSLGYKIKYKWTWKNYKDFIITVLIIVAICVALWFIPPTHNWIVSFYESNAIVKTVVDIIGRIFVGIWNAICSIFQ